MGAKSVLVIEDNDLNRKLFTAMLEMGSFKPLAAVDAETGLEMAREHRPNLILMDIQLPGMDGLSATRLIKADPDLKHIPVAALTAYAMPEDEQAAKSAGCTGYISKPVDTRTFVEKVSSFLDQAAVEENEEGDEDGEGFDHRKRILIVDDEPSNIKLLRAKLMVEGYEIASATNGEEALEKVSENAPELILLDIMMPGMDGFEVTRRLKNNPLTKSIPVILVTALDEEGNKEKGLEIGADDFLNKPVNTVELRARVRSLLRLKTYNDQLKVRLECEKRLVLPGADGKAESAVNDSPLLLLVEDDEKDAKLLLHYFAELPYRIEWVKDGREALRKVREVSVDLLVLDILLPNMDGYDVCRSLKKAKETANVQILMTTNLKDLESKIKGIELGADDYLVKPVNQYELKARVNALIRKKAQLDKLCRNYESAFSSAITDKLSTLYNRSYFDHFINIELKRSSRLKNPLALLMIDIDDFKQYNDRFGHLEGDRILKDFGEKIGANIRETDLGARYGGDEFVVVLPGMNQDEALSVAGRLKQAIEGGLHEPGAHEGGMKGPTVSMGMATYPIDGNSAEGLIAAADKALYSEKKDRKG